MGRLDATVRRFKALLFKDVAEDAQRNWLGRLPEVVATYNDRLGHKGCYGSRPNGVVKNNVLNFHIRQNMQEA